MEFHVSLPSGRCESVSVLGGTVADLKRAAQRSLGQSFLRLAAPDGRLLDPAEALQKAGLQGGENIVAVAQQPKIAATKGAFALWYPGCNKIVTWGDPNVGGQSAGVQDELRNVQEVHATAYAFAAILADGTVVSWGNPFCGGDCDGTAVLDGAAVLDQPKRVQQICSTSFAFAAILEDGHVVTWGIPDSGGDSSTVQDQLKNVQGISASHAAFAAILADGAVVTWGQPHFGGDCTAGPGSA